MLRRPFLEVTYRKGKPFAGYLYLRESSSLPICRTEEVRPGILLDIGADGQVLGIEFLYPGRVTPEDLEAIGEYLREADVPVADITPVLVR